MPCLWDGFQIFPSQCPVSSLLTKPSLYFSPCQHLHATIHAALPCIALPCIAFPCISLPCIAPPCIAPPCIALLPPPNPQMLLACLFSPLSIALIYSSSTLLHFLLCHSTAKFFQVAFLPPLTYFLLALIPTVWAACSNSNLVTL